MAIQDPAQLLQRIPELEPLAVEPRIRRAIEGGDPFKVYRALFWAKWLGRLPQHRDALKSLLRQRRLFAKPLRGTPYLGTLNSVGFSFVGSAERADGAHIATHAFVLLLGVPLFPLGAYLVSQEGTQYRIYARVPSGTLGWAYTRGIGAALVVALLFGIGRAAWDTGHQDLIVLNAFAQPLTVQVEGKPVTVPAKGRTTINLPEGEAALSARFANGFVVDELKQKIDPDTGIAVWNVAGAAPLMHEVVVYSKDAKIGPPGAPEIYCGKRYVEPDDADYEFETPPAQLSASEREKSLERTHLDIAEIPGMGQDEACINYLAGEHRLDEAAAALRARVAIDGFANADATGFAAFASKQESSAAVVAFVEQARKAQPDIIDVQRLYQSTLQEAGQSARVRDEFERAAREQPDSAAAQYLAAVLLDGEPGIVRLGELSNRFEESYILRTLVWRQWALGRHEAVASDWDRLLAQSPEDASRVLDAKVGAELALRRPERARDAIERTFAAPEAAHSPEMASNYALLAAQAHGDREAMFAKVEAGSVPEPLMDYFRIRAGLESKHGGASPMAVFAKAVRLDARSALAAARKLDNMEIAALPTDDWTLIYAEAARTNDTQLLARLRLNAQFETAELDRLRAYARGEAATLDGLDIDPFARAAASLVRSRNAALPAAERHELRRLAVAGDLLHTAISAAAKTWID